MNSRSDRQRPPARTKEATLYLSAKADVVFQNGNSFPVLPQFIPGSYPVAAICRADFQARFRLRKMRDPCLMLLTRRQKAQEEFRELGLPFGGSHIRVGVIIIFVVRHTLYSSS